MSSLKKQYKDEVRKTLKDKYKYANEMQVPKIEKIILHRGLGEAITNSKVIDITLDQFVNITGQKPLVTKSKKSISNFKLREGQPIGCKVTLRSDKMFDFLTKLINIVLPKIRDFRGVSTKGFDKQGNYTLGLKEDIIFPEVDYDKLDRSRGMDITIVTSSNTKEETFDLLQLLGMPFAKTGNKS
ncbi:50S ribosomal protein L5 [bacterium]|jgi:large subunit ribosomal protein L5|nr:50S ribosomal protein L5 [bacterium]